MTLANLTVPPGFGDRVGESRSLHAVPTNAVYKITCGFGRYSIPGNPGQFQGVGVQDWVQEIYSTSRRQMISSRSLVRKSGSKAVTASLGHRRAKRPPAYR